MNQKPKPSLLPRLLLIFSITMKRFTVASIIMQEEFNSAVIINGYQVPKDIVYNYFSENTRNFSRDELAMFIAQLIHESGGFKHTEQLGCLEPDNCQGIYEDGVGMQNKSYHGRGYIQLTWASNYKVAGESLGMGDLLLKKPELVATDQKIAMLVSVWYWLARVRPVWKLKRDSFGVTTKAINPEECITINKLARRRYQIYLKVERVLNISKKAKENGCYN